MTPKVLSIRIVVLTSLVAALILFNATASLSAADKKTPNDVFGRVAILKEHILALWAETGVNAPWPIIKTQRGKAPRHVLQKSLEVLEKIKQLRVIRGLGALSIPPYPARRITPEEPFDMVTRLVDEIEFLLTSDKIKEKNMHALEKKSFSGKNPNDVYRALWEISRAMDPVLGVKGFKPSDVYAQTLRVLDEIRFLRISQNLSVNVEKPALTTGKHPNHSLAETYALISKIADAEKNLRMEPEEVPKLERRVIEPQEVYDALQLVIAELQRIKYRIGVERGFITPEFKSGKTPDDIVQNIRWAIRLMPDFDPRKELIQYDQNTLNKTPNHVYALTEHILKEVFEYKAIRGVQTIPRAPEEISGKSPADVYQKTLECLEKVFNLRIQIGLGPVALPGIPNREITPVNVYDLAVRLDHEFGIVYSYTGTNYEDILVVPLLYSDKTPDDVYENILRISYTIDTLTGDRKADKR